MAAVDRDPEAMARELLAIAHRRGPDGEPLYGKSDFREALPLLLVASCPLEGTIVIPDDIASLLSEQLGAQPRSLTRSQLTEIVRRHFQQHPPTSPFVEAVNHQIVQWCAEAGRDEAKSAGYAELLSLTPSGTTTVADEEKVFRAGFMAQHHVKAPDE